MKKGQIVEGIIERVDFPNKGILRTEDGTRVIVKNAIMGQKVSAAVNKVRKGKCEGRLLEILEKSALELPEPGCVHYGICGGCTFQSLPYEEQLKMKEKQVKDLIDAVITEENKGYEFLPIKASPRPKAYRNKMEFSFGDEYKDGPLALGMHKRGSFYDIVNVGECQIVDEDFRRVLKITLEYFKEKQIPFYHKLRHTGYLRHFLVRKAAKTGEILVDLVTTTQMEELSGENESALLEGWVKKLCEEKYDGVLKGILHTKNDSVADTIKNEGTDILFGQDFFYEELLGLKFKITPFSFFQTNSLGAEVLYQTAREFIGDALDDEANQTVFDLYSGTGTIAQILSPVAKKVIGVEIVEEAVVAARENAALNGLTNCEFIAGDVLKVIDTIGEKPDYIVLDPPRDGIHPKALEKIIRYNVPQMVYISCKPTSLARDLEVLQARGYQVKKVQCVDMFPATGNCETVVLLSKGEVDSKKIRVEFSLEDMDMSEFQDGATYTQIKDYVLEHSGLKVSNLYISQIKRKCGIEVGKNYNLPKSEDSRQPQCPPEKEKAIREAFKYFGMI
ncbi:23S rRNA (uracil(1939)-C(5))-methyltransferase RlmD [Roseburia sp. AM23-20]|mgnify:FL=1|uniref:23S rRNA (uracil(1939)-C(5))-methyltransferase RlmD n=1 Tax=Roseburia sp. AM23-20 TaxID=2292066 RepID=UPI000E51393D|nr:23S rRNA (uracil(1939)-C(5))-methyltransferase RlmD [Roseburia sp. AM23-20]RHF94754.1 23S rRNA (uracil(1939)-C(5))-methyltransferase RlmD [Roseburia sp. AM23-20]